MGSTSSAIFTGSSNFSADFQNVVTRAVNIASLPIAQLNNDLTALKGQQSAVRAIDAKFSALQTAIDAVQGAVGGSSFQASVSDPTLVSASVSDGAVEGNYSIEVIDAGAYTTSLSTATWVNTKNADGSRHTYRLWVGDTSDARNEIDITPADNSAQSVSAAINAAAGSKVRAVAVNVGDATIPDWRISLQAVKLGNTPLDIWDGTTSLQTQTLGRSARYIVNASSKTVTSDSRSVTIASGLTVSLLGSKQGTNVNITVTRSTSALSTALADFAGAYNDVVDELDSQRGQADGALKGDSSVYALSQTLTQIATYSNSGGQFSGLKDLGFDLGVDGHLTFVPLQLMAADFRNSAGVTSFLGTESGGGFLKKASALLDSARNSDTGILANTGISLQRQMDQTNSDIEEKQAQVDRLQDRLLAQMAAADAAIAGMEQQYGYVANMFESMRVASEQYK